MNDSPEKTVERLLREVVPHHGAKGSFHDDMSLRADLAIDSIGLMSLAFRLEEELCIDLMEHADQVANIETIGDVVRFVRSISQPVSSS